MDKEPTFQDELQALINKHCLERHSNTPDFILAEYMATCLHAFNLAVRERDRASLPRKAEPVETVTA